MLEELPKGRWRATHRVLTPHGFVGEEKEFASRLAAKCWMIVMDDRRGTNSWALSPEVSYAE